MRVEGQPLPLSAVALSVRGTRFGPIAAGGGACEREDGNERGTGERGHRLRCTRERTVLMARYAASATTRARAERGGEPREDAVSRRRRRPSGLCGSFPRAATPFRRSATHEGPFPARSASAPCAGGACEQSRAGPHRRWYDGRAGRSRPRGGTARSAAPSVGEARHGCRAPLGLHARGATSRADRGSHRRGNRTCGR